MWNKSGTSKICGRQTLKTLKGYSLLNHIPSSFFKGCLPQILLGPLLKYFVPFVLRRQLGSSPNFAADIKRI